MPPSTLLFFIAVTLFTVIYFIVLIIFEGILTACQHVLEIGHDWHQKHYHSR